MRVPLPYNTTEVPGEIANKNLFAPALTKGECRLTLRHQAKRTCRLCDPISGQCRHLCVRKSSRKIK